MYINEINNNYFSNNNFIKKTVDNEHSIIKDSVKKNIEKFNFQIRFIEPTWVLKQEGGGFDGHYITRASQLDTTPFGVLSVEKDKKKQCSKIHVWSDGICDGQNCFLINVPNGLFKRVN